MTDKLVLGSSISYVHSICMLFFLEFYITYLPDSTGFLISYDTLLFCELTNVIAFNKSL